MDIDFLKNKNQKKQFMFSYTIFVVNGMVALSVGSLIPFIRDARGLNYLLMGWLVSLHSVGNLIGPLAGGILANQWGRRKSSLFLSCSYSLAFIFILLANDAWLLMPAFFLTGVARGTNTFFCNTSINSLAPGKAWIINGLHGMFAVGALAFPLILTVVTLNNADDWVLLIYFLIFLGAANWLFYYFFPQDDKKKTIPAKEVKKENGFFKEPIFYFVTATLFFYLAGEQAVIGWLVTYFIDSGFLSDSLSQLMASLLWGMILIGRFSVAWLSTKFAKGKMLLTMAGGIAVFFLLLIFSQTTPFIILGIMGFGLSMSGIYPTTVTYAGQLIQNYPMAWSMIATLAALGGIFMHNVVGIISQNFGIAAGMSSIAVVLVIVLGLIISLNIYTKKNP